MLGWQGWGSSSRQELGRDVMGSQALGHLLSLPFQAQRKAASFRKLPRPSRPFVGQPLGARSCEQARLGVRG